MAQLLNRRIILKTRATGLPTPDLFEMVEDNAPKPGDGELLVHSIYLSADPAMKGWIGSTKNYASVETGATMNSFGLGVVVESRHPDYAEGDFVSCQTGWQEYAVARPDDVAFRKVDPADGPVSTALGVLGLNGITAYFGLLDVGQPKAGATVLVSTAAGAVGSAVGQIAKIKSCHTVGITGGPEKTALCRDVFGYDEVIDYKATDDLGTALQSACPEGIDIYYDNVGGDTLDTVLPLMNMHGRISICGTASVDAWLPPPTGLRPERHILVSRLRIQGFIIFDYFDRYPEALANLKQWISEGKLKYREDIAEGLENAPSVLAGLYEGRNMGRQLIRIRPDPTLQES